jgi:hypothetical protein
MCTRIWQYLSNEWNTLYYNYLRYMLPKSSDRVVHEEYELFTINDEDDGSDDSDQGIFSGQLRTDEEIKELEGKGTEDMDIDDIQDYLSDSENEFEFNPMVTSQILLPMKRANSFPQVNASKRRKISSREIHILSSS